MKTFATMKAGGGGGESGGVFARVSTEINADLYAVFDRATQPNCLPWLFLRWGPFPAVARAIMEGGEAEEIMISLRPLRYRYRIRQAGVGLLSRLAAKGCMDWAFTPSNGNTRVTWEADFTVPSPVMRPFVRLLLRTLYVPFQRRCLTVLKHIVEQEQRETGGLLCETTP